MNEYKTFQEFKLNYFDCLIIFLAILFKYLINFGMQPRYMYSYLLGICLLTLINIYYKKFTINEFNKIILFFSLSTYFVVVYKNANFLISFLLAVICIRRNNKDFIKIFFISSLILYLSTILLSMFGILHSNEMIRIVDGTINKRTSLGFTHPNEVFLYFIPIALCGYYLYGNKFTYYIILIATSSVLYKLSYCRTGYITVLCVVGLNFFKNILIKFKLKNILPYTMVVLTIISIFIAKLYGNDLDNNISNLLSQRPNLWNYYIENGYMLSILGKGIHPDYIMDNFYLFLLVEMGITGYFIYFIIYYKSLKHLRHDIKLLIIILILYIYGLTETNIIIGSIQFVFSLQIKSIIINNKKINKEDKYNG